MKSSTNANSKRGGSGMFRIRDLKNGQYQVHVNEGPAFEGTLKPIMKKCLELGMRLEEVEMAIVELGANGDDIAEFGVRGYFMYTLKDEKVA